MFEKSSPQQPQVAVSNRLGDDPQAIEQEVREALAAANASIHVEPLNKLEE